MRSSDLLFRRFFLRPFALVRQNRQRNVIWYNPPFSKNVKTNIAHDFLQLIDKHFPPSNRLSTLFNRHTVRVSYSCTENMKAFITRHNKTVLRKQANETQTTKNTDLRYCNCRRADECPTGGKCLQKSGQPREESLYWGRS